MSQVINKKIDRELGRVHVTLKRYVSDTLEYGDKNGLRVVPPTLDDVHDAILRVILIQGFCELRDQD